MTDAERPDEVADSAPEPEADEPEPSAEARPVYRPGAGEPRPRLYRSQQSRIVSGVAGGMAEYFDTDPAIVRLLWVLATAMGGAGALAYLVLWIVVPSYSRLYGEAQPAAEGSEAAGVPAKSPRVPLRTDVVFGGILVVVGTMLLMGSLGLGPGWDIFARLWPLVLIVPGAMMVTPRRGRWPSTGVLLVGGVILAAGAINLLGSLDIWWGYSAWGRLWPLILVAIGAAFLLPRMDARD